VLASRSRVFAGEGFTVLGEVASGLMQEHRSLEFEVSRVFSLQPRAEACPLFVAEGRKIGLLPHEIDKAAK
jgi:hypothetical protein